MKLTKKRYIKTFGIVVIILSLVRCVFPQVAQPETGNTSSLEIDTTFQDTISTVGVVIAADDVQKPQKRNVIKPVDRKYHPIYSVPRFKDCFPDSQMVHEIGARRWGVKPVANREDAERRKSELVYVGANPYFYVENLRQSIPYLVPRAAVLLNDIGRQFYDSLYVKGIPFHKIIVTSVLRTKDDVQNLRQRNGNATENSCHMYGTTVDICYNRYKTVQAPGENRREVRNDTLKWVLAEVLRDVRESNRCYIKYEVKQGCFHLTVK